MRIMEKFRTDSTLAFVVIELVLRNCQCLTVKEMGLRLSRALMPYGMVVFSAVNGGQSEPHVQPSLRAVEYSSGVS